MLRVTASLLSNSTLPFLLLSSLVFASGCGGGLSPLTHEQKETLIAVRSTLKNFAEIQEGVFSGLSYLERGEVPSESQSQPADATLSPQQRLRNWMRDQIVLHKCVFRRPQPQTVENRTTAEGEVAIEGSDCPVAMTATTSTVIVSGSGADSVSEGRSQYEGRHESRTDEAREISGIKTLQQKIQFEWERRTQNSRRTGRFLTLIEGEIETVQHGRIKFTSRLRESRFDVDASADVELDIRNTEWVQRFELPGFVAEGKVVYDGEGQRTYYINHERVERDEFERVMAKGPMGI
jgi:hypothetical protein